MHRGPGTGSASSAATEYGRQHGITVIDGGCPLMFGATADFGHKIMRLVYAGHVPKQVGASAHAREHVRNRRQDGGVRQESVGALRRAPRAVLTPANSTSPQSPTETAARTRTSSGACAARPRRPRATGACACLDTTRDLGGINDGIHQSPGEQPLLRGEGRRTADPPDSSGRRYRLDLGVHVRKSGRSRTSYRVRPAWVGGASAGAAIALDLAVRRPDLVRAVVVHEAPWRALSHPSASGLRTLARVPWLGWRGGGAEAGGGVVGC